MEAQASLKPFVKAEMKDWPSERVIELAGYVNELVANPAWQEVRDLLSEVERVTFKSMEKGLLEQAQYAKNMGFLSGIRQLPEIADAILEQAEKVRKGLSELERNARA